jgi:hypothetical protein
MNRPVRVGNVQQMSGARPMDTDAPPPPTTESNFERNMRILEERNLLPPVVGTTGGGLAGYEPRPRKLRPFSGLEYLPGVAGSRSGQGGTGFGARAAERFGEQPQELGFSRADVLAELMAMMGMGGGGGGGASRPDFSAYRAALTDQAAGLNAQIQAMYNALGEEAGANVGRIQEIYGGAEQGIGNVYDSAAGNVADAFSSSQQQAADQLARLGIEAAAPAVINPAALAQAQAVSGLEQGRASGQAAAQRYGASAGGFGSQMAQVAQQQGTETNAAILASLQNRLAESLAAEQTGGGGGGGGRAPSVSDQLRLLEYADEEFNRRAGIPTPAQEQWGYEQNFRLNQAAADLAQNFLPQNRDATPEQIQEALALATSILTR